MTRLAILKRQFGFLALGLLLTLGLILPQAVGAALPPPGSTAEINPAAAGSSIVQLALPPKFTKIHAWRSAGGNVDVQVETENAYNVVLTMAGNISLHNHDSYAWGDVWHFKVTGLTPNMLYMFQVDAIGALTTAHATGMVTA